MRLTWISSLVQFAPSVSTHKKLSLNLAKPNFGFKLLRVILLLLLWPSNIEIEVLLSSKLQSYNLHCSFQIYYHYASPLLNYSMEFTEDGTAGYMPLLQTCWDQYSNTKDMQYEPVPGVVIKYLWDKPNWATLRVFIGLCAFRFSYIFHLYQAIQDRNRRRA
ncbi:hypothetical protein VNO77_27343 [Canavalia gladiata]|uniref:Uncharacterized protein n=1 Tax=Canavalia gladiata TaxID=3824 RepID=A0AAN9KUI5_CANGL